jgi:hypothetical protein
MEIKSRARAKEGSTHGTQRTTLLYTHPQCLTSSCYSPHVDFVVFGVQPPSPFGGTTKLSGRSGARLSPRSPRLPLFFSNPALSKYFAHVLHHKSISMESKEKRNRSDSQKNYNLLFIYITPPSRALAAHACMLARIMQVQTPTTD